MKKYIVEGILVVALIVYILFKNENSGSGLSSAVAPVVATNEPGSPTTVIGTYKNGTYTGKVADAIYGNLQVMAVVNGGKITDVQFPVFPNSPGHTSQVSASALPTLKQEAIAAQSAQVNIVSGATQDSQAFQESLADALAQAAQS